MTFIVRDIETKHVLGIFEQLPDAIDFAKSVGSAATVITMEPRLGVR